MDRSSIKEYYARVTAVDIGRVARDLIGDRLTAERNDELRFDCPHHESRSKASFIVDLGKQAFFCKGCGVGGDVLQMVEFVQSGQVTSHRKGAMTDSHRAARDYLASVAGMPPLSEHGLSPDELKKIESKRQEEESVFAVLGDVAQRYHEKLIARADVLEWFTGQYAISKKTVERLKIGFADNDGLLDYYLRKQRGHSWKAINKSGCVTLSKRDGEPYPFFRNRIVFPYWKQGRCVYMIGRRTQWTPDSKYELPKYKKLPTHSPGRSYISPVVQNSVFYNEDCLVAEQDEVVITEGVSDCIALMERGIATVSPVTVCFRDKDHNKLLSLVRHVKKVFICQDNEISGVGLTGALKTARFLSRNKIAVRLVELPLTPKQENARAALSEHGIQPGMEAKALDEIKQALDEDRQQDIEKLLDDAKIDLNEYLLDATMDDFRKLTDEAPRHFEWQIKRLDPKPVSSLERNEDLKPVVETLAELDPLDQSTAVALLQEHYGGGKTLPKKLIEDSVKDATRRMKAATQRPAILSSSDDSIYIWKNTLLAFRGDRVVEVREMTGPNGEHVRTEVVIANFRMVIDRERVIDCGFGTVIRDLHGTIHVESKGRFPFTISAEDFYTNHVLSRKLGAIVGPLLQFEANDLERIRNLCVHFAKFPTVTIVQCFGPHSDYGFVTPSATVKDGEIRPNDSEKFRCDLSRIENKSVRLLDLAPMPPDEVPAVGRHVLNELFALTPLHVSRCLAGHTFLAPVYQRLRTQYNPYVLFCNGVTGTGKTSVAQLWQNFFGDFSKKGTLVSWGSTPKTLEKAGHYFHGALFVTDDFKKANIGYHWNDARRILQGYADGHDRGRLKQNAEFRASEMIRGMLLVTGEDLPEGEASNLARMIEISFNGVRYGPELRRLYSCCIQRQHLYRGLMAHYVAWTQKTSDEQLLDLVSAYCRRLDEALGPTQVENRPRICQNFALMLTGLNLFLAFLEDHGVITAAEAERHVAEHVDWATGAMLETAEAVHDERAGVTFLDILRSLIATGRASLGDLLATGAGRFSYRTECPVSNAVGYRSGDLVYVLRDVAMKEVSEFLSRGGRTLEHGTKGISSQLLADGVIVPNARDKYSRAVWRLRINGERVACYRMAKGVLACEDYEGVLGRKEDGF